MYEYIIKKYTVTSKYWSNDNPKQSLKKKTPQESWEEKKFLTMEEGLCGDEEGGGAHPQQHDELQEPEAEIFTRPKQSVSLIRRSLTKNECVIIWTYRQLRKQTLNFFFGGHGVIIASQWDGALFKSEWQFASQSIPAKSLFTGRTGVESLGHLLTLQPVTEKTLKADQPSNLSTAMESVF